MANLQQVYKNLGRHADAERLQAHVVGVKTRIFGEHDPKKISTMSNSAVEHERPENKFANAEDAQNNSSPGGDRLSAEGPQSPTNSESQQKKKGSYPLLYRQFIK